MRIHRTVNVLVLLILLAVTAGNARLASAGGSSPDSVVTWQLIAQRVIVANAKLGPSPAIVSMAYVQAAVYDAVVAIEGHYKPYAVKLKKNPKASVDAAVAAAAYHVLVYYFPAQKADLDADYAANLALVADGKAKTAGIELGKAAADGLIAKRTGDGYMADVGYVVPAPGPGVWQPLPGQVPAAPWLAKMKPFLLKSNDQFDPGEPPELTSEEWARDYNEVKEIGSIDSQTRTPYQTDTSLFFTAHAIPLYDSVYSKFITDLHLNAEQTARMYAMVYLIGADVNIGCYQAKYKYNFWRPITAIQQGDTDGNPDTTGDPAWTPLIGTYPFPEYISGHGCNTAAAGEVMAKMLGTRKIKVTVVSNIPNLVDSDRYYKTVDDLKAEIIEARIWSGLHYRFSDVEGVRLGTRVARWALERYFLPTD